MSFLHSLPYPGLKSTTDSIHSYTSSTTNNRFSVRRNLKTGAKLLVSSIPHAPKSCILEGFTIIYYTVSSLSLIVLFFTCDSEKGAIKDNIID